jgi:hypothetical protein
MSVVRCDCHQGVLDRMGRDAVGQFARLYVMPHGNHGLGANNFDVAQWTRSAHHVC